MPFVRNMFIVGALALSGIPILNGFWSKELILEAGLVDGPASAYILMLVGAGITALYTLRCVWLVFYDVPRSDLHAHDAGPAMRMALLPLAIGSFLTWLLAGGLSAISRLTLPFHTIHEVTTMEMVKEVVTAPATLVALLVIAVGLASWVWRGKLVSITGGLRFIARWAENSFGFESINASIVKFTNSTAESLRDLQTGYLNWNIFAVMGGLILLLVILIWGA